jgi:hypothetical protein
MSDDIPYATNPGSFIVSLSLAASEAVAEIARDGKNADLRARIVKRGDKAELEVEHLF